MSSQTLIGPVKKTIMIVWKVSRKNMPKRVLSFSVVTVGGIKVYMIMNKRLPQMRLWKTGSLSSSFFFKTYLRPKLIPPSKAQKTALNMRVSIGTGHTVPVAIRFPMRVCVTKVTTTVTARL